MGPGRNKGDEYEEVKKIKTLLIISVIKKEPKNVQRFDAKERLLTYS
jgi:hypothetical protein